MVGADVEENPRGTQVFKTQVSLLRLEFHFFFFTFFWVPSILLRADLTQRSSSSSRPIGAPTFFLTPSLRQIIPLFVSILRLFLAFIRSSSLLKTRSSTQSLKIKSSTLSLKIKLSTNVLLQPDHPPSTRSSSLMLQISNQIVFFGATFFFKFCFSSSPTKIEFQKLSFAF